jgi:hypothetical protein
VEDLVDLHGQRLGDVVPHQLEPVVVQEVLDIGPRPGEEVVEANDLVSLLQKSLAKMRAHES